MFEGLHTLLAASEQPLPPAFSGGAGLAGGFWEPPGNRGAPRFAWHRAATFLPRRKLMSGSLLVLIFGPDLLGASVVPRNLVWCRFNPQVVFSNSGESFAGAMQLSAHGVRRLIGQIADLLVAQFLIRHEQEQQPVFIRQGIENFLNQPAQFLDFENAQRRIGLRDGASQTASSVLVNIWRSCQACCRFRQ